jgi:hypothetical protein
LGQKCGQKSEFIDIRGIGKPESVTLLKSTFNLKAIEIHDNFDAVIELSLLFSIYLFSIIWGILY